MVETTLDNFQDQTYHHKERKESTFKAILIFHKLNNNHHISHQAKSQVSLKFKWLTSIKIELTINNNDKSNYKVTWEFIKVQDTFHPTTCQQWVVSTVAVNKTILTAKMKQKNLEDRSLQN